jgi:endonuclease YncB( thermonuclease family)
MRILIPALVCLPNILWADVSGPIRVVDGDTLQIGDVTIRLFGIDAPEADQTCQSDSGDSWPCGVWVTEQVAARFGGQMADCATLEQDRYGRDVARCHVARQDVGRVLVAAGLATAYRAYAWDYDLEEKSAQLARLGIWAGSFQQPAAFRADQAPEGSAPPGDCAIKGNISGNGRIYHMPGQENYADTVIDAGDGERWFCSVAEAEAAGWRAARR